jgi:hypothetical protein
MAGPAPKNDDDALLRRLYDEPDADGDAEVESLRRLRGAVAEYARATELEPPSRGLDELMAAARARVAHAAPAVVPATSTGFWARARAWFTPIARHPALASAAAVVVIGGLAGVLYVKGITGAERTASVEVPAEEAAGARVAHEQAPTPATPATGSAQGMMVTLDDRVQDVPPPETAPSDPVAVAKPDVKLRRPTPRPPRDVAEKKPARGEGTKGAGGGGSVADGYAGGGDGVKQKPLEIAAPDPTPKRPGTATTTRDPAPPELAEPAAEPQPNFGADGDHDASVDVETTAKGEAPRNADPQPRGPSLDQLTRQARTAAKSGDCAVVKNLARRVRSASPDYYKRSFATDADIKKCL